MKKDERMRKEERKINLHCSSNNPEFSCTLVTVCSVTLLPTSGSVAWTLVSKALVAVFS